MTPAAPRSRRARERRTYYRLELQNSSQSRRIDRDFTRCIRAAHVLFIIGHDSSTPLMRVQRGCNDQFIARYRDRLIAETLKHGCIIHIPSRSCAPLNARVSCIQLDLKYYSGIAITPLISIVLRTIAS